MALTICTCTLSVKDELGNAVTTAELICEPRKSQVSSGTGVYVSAPKRATADANGLCTLALAETTTSQTQVVFRLVINDGSLPVRDVLFDPIYIPNQASVDLSTLLTVSRG